MLAGTVHHNFHDHFKENGVTLYLGQAWWQNGRLIDK